MINNIYNQTNNKDMTNNIINLINKQGEKL